MLSVHIVLCRCPLRAVATLQLISLQSISFVSQDPTLDPGLLTREWSALAFGAANAAAVSQAVLLSEALWMEQRIPFVDDYAIAHATWFVPKFKPGTSELRQSFLLSCFGTIFFCPGYVGLDVRGRTLAQGCCLLLSALQKLADAVCWLDVFYGRFPASGAESDGWGLVSLLSNTTLATVRRSNKRAAGIAARMLALAGRVDPGQVPSWDAVALPPAFEGAEGGRGELVRDGRLMTKALGQAANKTALFLRTICDFREAYMLNASLAMSTDACADLKDVLVRHFPAQFPPF